MKTEPVMGTWSDDDVEQERVEPVRENGAQFYGGARREALLEQILHLQQFVPGMVVVLAEAGLGKTTLCERLSKRLPGAGLRCVLNAGALVDSRQVFAEIANLLELPFESSAGQQLASIRTHVQEPEAPELIVVIDDAHLLDDHVLSGLMSLLQGVDINTPTGLSLILFGLPELADRIDRFQMIDVQVNDLVIPPLSIPEVAEYLLLKFPERLPTGRKAADSRLAANVWQESSGSPALIDEIMLRDPVDSAAPAVPGLRQQASRYVWHIVAAAALGACLLLIVLYRGGDDDATAAVKTVELALPNPVLASGGNQAGQETEALPIVATPPSGPVSAFAPPAKSQTNALPAGNASSVAEEEFGVERRASEVREAAAPVTVPADVAVVRQAQPEASAAVVDAPKPPVSVVSKPAVPAPAKPAPSLPAPVAPATKVSRSADEQYLLSVNPQHFALQLLAAESRTTITKYLAQQPNAAQMRVYETLRGGKRWYVVVLGDYAQKAQAQKAILGLTEGQRKAGPWPKSYAAIRAEITVNRGN